MHEPAMRRKRIVIIDDEEDLCLLMKSYFHALGYDVFLANTLDSGMHLLKEVSPDILFLDNNLPDGLVGNKPVMLRTLIRIVRSILLARLSIPRRICREVLFRLLRNPCA
jgi:two-component system, OmpR family, response regulator